MELTALTSQLLLLLGYHKLIHECPNDIAPQRLMVFMTLCVYRIATLNGIHSLQALVVKTCTRECMEFGPSMSDMISMLRVFCHPKVQLMRYTISD